MFLACSAPACRHEHWGGTVPVNRTLCFAAALAAALVATFIPSSQSWATAITTAGPTSGNAPQCNQSGAISASCFYIGNPEFHYVPLQSTSNSFADLAS